MIDTARVISAPAGTEPAGVTPTPTLTHHGPGRPTATAVRRLRLSIVEGPGVGSVWESTSARSAIGSHPSCDLVVDDATVSRFHCEIQLDERRGRVRDMGSRNGTLLDGVPVVDAYLREGSVLRLGRTAVRLSFGEQDNTLPLSAASSFACMVGSSVAMRATFALLERAARSDATVLLAGETGTGKTLAARSIHVESARRNGPFVVIDCGALPGNLLESELFGHERGAFTGAEGQRTGAFEEANGGTLFLDEIGEVPLELQPKLLGALESRTIRRVGSNRMRPVDVRIIAATNRDLRQEVNAGRFRSDLYYRLAVLTIDQPSLRERVEDIPQIASAMLTALGATPEQISTLLDPAMLERLQHGSWPGNSRQLRNYLERCLVFDAAIPLPEDEGAQGSVLAVDARQPYAEARERAIKEFERLYLHAILQRHSRISDAAASAGIDRTYFYRLLRRHGIRKA